MKLNKMWNNKIGTKPFNNGNIFKQILKYLAMRVYTIQGSQLKKMQIQAFQYWEVLKHCLKMEKFIKTSIFHIIFSMM